MIIYLYVKTHRQTGLKYLGQTTQDPYRYKGSGRYWMRHLKVHGTDIETTILHECSSKDEAIKLGRHYSTLWNIVESIDWANLKPEEGQGSSSGKYNPMYGRTGENNPLFGIERLDMKGDKNISHRQDVIDKKSGANHFLNKNPELMEERRRKMSGNNNPAKNPEVTAKYSGANHTRYDHIVYCWEHIETNERVSMTRRQFIETYHNTPAGPGKIRALILGDKKTYKGWRVIKD